MLIDALESGHSEVLAAYLSPMAKFHYYSFGNLLLIAMQKPGATRVAGMYSWNQPGRRVRRGEKGIMIVAPMVSRRRKKEDQNEEQTEAKATTIEFTYFDNGTCTIKTFRRYLVDYKPLLITSRTAKSIARVAKPE